MKNKLVATTLCMCLCAGCYVKTSLEGDKRYLPADFSTPVLVVTVQDTVGLQGGLLAELEQDVLAALSDRNIESITLYEAVGDTDDVATIAKLRSKDYRALLKININQWGPKTELMQDPVPTSVSDSDTGPDAGSSFRPPTAFASGETMPGPESSYKEVAMVAWLTDLQTDRLIWSGGLDAKPGVVGRSFLYHRFNRDIKYEDLARRCFRRLAKELDHLLSKDSKM
jgi:hypothetical protein